MNDISMTNMKLILFLMIFGLTAIKSSQQAESSNNEDIDSVEEEDSNSLLDSALDGFHIEKEDDDRNTTDVASADNKKSSSDLEQFILHNEELLHQEHAKLEILTIRSSSLEEKVEFLTSTINHLEDKLSQVVNGQQKQVGIKPQQQAVGVNSLAASGYSDNQYVGCYQDDGNQRDFPFPVNLNGPYNSVGDGLTIDKAINDCRSRGYTYAGVQYFYNSFCGDTYGKYWPLPDTRCNTACDGNRFENCGGTSANSIYSVCPFGKYGTSCQYDCHCANLQCNLRTGRCLNNTACATGWAGPQCNMPDYHGGVTYTRWGRTECPYSAQAVYEGSAASSHFTDAGGGSDYLCIPEKPEWGSVLNGRQSWRSYLCGVEYAIDSPGYPFSTTNNNGQNLQANDAPCVVCHVPTRSNQLMIPAKLNCPVGWVKEYNGYLATSYHSHHRSSYVCVDGAPEVMDGGQAAMSGALWHPVEGACDTALPCPKYVDGWEISCVVCTK